MKTERQLLKEYINYVLETHRLTEALEVHDTLNPILWDGMELKRDVFDKLLEIAHTFVDNLNFPLDVVDIRIVGSNASFNYNGQSDIDLHIITNFDLNYVDNAILQQLYNDEKNSFNNRHEIFIKDIPVELYIEDMHSINATNGSYSLLKDDWVKIPQPITYEIPDYHEELNTELKNIDTVLKSNEKETIKNEINKIYMMRKDGLALEGEASKGNLVFKELRNLGAIQELTDKFYELESQELSLESENLTEDEDYVDNKEKLLQMVRNATNDQLYFLYLEFTNLGFTQEDRRKSKRGFVLDCIENNYKINPENRFDEATNRELECSVINGIDHDDILLKSWSKTEDDEEVTRKSLNNSPVKLSTYWQDSEGIDQHDTREFPNVRALFKWIDECGGIRDAFQGIKWFIYSEYQGGEYYLVRDRFAKGGWSWEDCNGRAIDRQSKEFRHSTESQLNEWGEETSEDIEYRECIDLIRRAYGPNYKIPARAGLPALRNIARSAKKVLAKRDEEAYAQAMEQKAREDEHPLYKYGKNGEVYIRTDSGGYEKLDDSENLTESERLNEYNLQDVLDDSRATDPKRIELSKSIYTEYKGVDSDGTLIFESDSQTRSGVTHTQRIFYEGFFNLLDKADENEKITDEDVVNILTGDLMIDCTCESFLYWAWAYKSWKKNYGLRKELREPKRNNTNLNGGACKHILSMLELLNRSDSLFDKIAEDLNKLFQSYKKTTRITPTEEPKEEKPEYTPVDNTQFARTAANLARKGKTNKKLNRNPKAAQYNISNNEQ